MRKLVSTTENLVSIVELKDSSIENLFAELDQSIALSRATLDAAEKQLQRVPETDWHLVREKAAERDIKDCPICIMPLRGKPQALLSCSHIFHHSCLKSFEHFAAATRGNTGCPLCREVYQSIELSPNWQAEASMITEQLQSSEFSNFACSCSTSQ